LKNKSLITRVPQPLNLESKSPRFWKKKRSKESWHAIYDGKDLMVKMGKLVQKFKNRFFGMNSLKKWLNK
jgi:hypothetical protein